MGPGANQNFQHMCLFPLPLWTSHFGFSFAPLQFATPTRLSLRLDNGGIMCGDEDEKQKDVNLTEEGYKIKNMLRLTIGSKKENLEFMKVTKNIFKK